MNEDIDAVEARQDRVDRMRADLARLPLPPVPSPPEPLEKIDWWVLLWLLIKQSVSMIFYYIVSLVLANN